MEGVLYFMLRHLALVSVIIAIMVRVAGEYSGISLSIDEEE